MVAHHIFAESKADLVVQKGVYLVSPNIQAKFILFYFKAMKLGPVLSFVGSRKSSQCSLV